MSHAHDDCPLCYEDQENVIDWEHIHNQRAWSLRTFGPGQRTEGLIEHITQELEEVRETPNDVYEWVDVIILALDGAWRSGHEPQAIIDAIKNKQEINEQRDWPDWKQFTDGEAITHLK